MRGYIGLLLLVATVLLSTLVLLCSYRMMPPEEIRDFGWSKNFRHDMVVASNEVALRQVLDNDGQDNSQNATNLI
ncbi:hypothetical protein THRCLA_22555 [Thraustotheca clavata]|uniref:Uncharacterized protein n=1 Tax=Thraustotheca clavata TaxID=74557 RepID=A0A1V9YXK1_9STRA|nr:hypothetical protein THRCLA_22555 [Thraustotheca clavata]